MDDYCRRKDDSYFDRYRDSFDGRGPPGPESQSRAKGKVAETALSTGRTLYKRKRKLITNWKGANDLAKKFTKRGNTNILFMCREHSA